MSDQLECTVSATKSSDFKHIVGMRHFGEGGGGEQITVQRYFVFESILGLWTLYIQELLYTNTFCECILRTIGPTHAHLQYNTMKLMSFKSVLL